MNFNLCAFDYIILSILKGVFMGEAVVRIVSHYRTLENLDNEFQSQKTFQSWRYKNYLFRSK